LNTNVDHLLNSLGDLIGFEGYLNVTAPFVTTEHRSIWKSSRQYLDFSIGNGDYNETCTYPRFWNETGFPVDASVNQQLIGCYDSDFDQYGDTEAFGVYPDWRRQLTKFASVQDRLREWHTPVRLKLERFYCMLIAQLDIDGFRYDKALQSTVDALGEMNHAMRRCARRHGKENFLLVGELTGGNDLASVWLGRGRQPDMYPPNLTEAATAGYTTQEYSLRPREQSALDGAAFHYSVYRSLTRFLGLDGNLEAGYDTPINPVDLWNTLLTSNDLFNPNTGEFDPRHMYGSGNQDLFRWPAIANGTQRQLLANFVTTMLLPGIPLVLWGEEQAFYVLDNTASNYIFGRQPISASSAWQSHGCYSLDSTQYYQWPVESARQGCHDNTVSYDHRDPSAPIRNILKHMYYLRDQYVALRDGAWLQQLSNQTRPIIYPGSSGVVTETGMWSVLRSGIPNVQNFTSVEEPHGNTSVWLLYSNENATTTHQFNCSDPTQGLDSTALLAPFDVNTILKNLLYPYDVVQLQNSTQYLGINGSINATGCLSNVTLDAYGFKAYVPIFDWVAPRSAITRFIVNGSGGHDSRILSATNASEPDRVSVQLSFSSELNCASVTDSITLTATTASTRHALLDESTVFCSSVVQDDPQDDLLLQGRIPSVWYWSADLYNVEDGIHRITVGNLTEKDSVDHFLFRIGQSDNPVVFPRSANYSTSLVQQDDNGNMYLSHTADGADLWRYTTNWGSSFSPWTPYTGDDTSISDLEWSGTDKQAWSGKHVRVEYFSRLAGTSDIVQEGDLDSSSARRYPHLFWNGPYNAYGFDSGLENSFKQNKDGLWQFDFMTEWPAFSQVNVWGLNPDGQPDETYVFGDVDGDSILDRLPPSSLATAIINITTAPATSNVAWTVLLDDATNRFTLTSSGSSTFQIVLFSLLYPLPLIFAALAVFAFMRGFYKVKFNQKGAVADTTFTPAILTEKLKVVLHNKSSTIADTDTNGFNTPARHKIYSRSSTMSLNTSGGFAKAKEEDRRTVLIATMEYDIEDWKIKVKIGGLGVMAQLMGKALTTQDLIWVIPCIGGVEYPIDTPAEPMKVTILGIDYSIQVQYHQVNNIKYILLDAPVFRHQTMAEPYPARMDDMASAIYYSAWNQCIAQTMRRFPIDLYHINDYHGCIAPLYLLPNTIPVCFSLHNAEFQGLWPMKTAAESAEVSKIFNLTLDVVQKFVQFGQVFNLLHAGASYLRVFQQGFGAVGVSKKYGKRAYLRYPIFWGLKNIGQLPNPDPTDTADWNGLQLAAEEDTTVDEDFEAQRPALRVEAQKWAGLEQDADAELFVFVGRWSKQKGVDLIADIFPSILKRYPKTQLICIGPVIDLYGKFAALKLEALMKEYPTRVYSKPVFTALPPCIFSGAEFALIPSRDEPFGLVAVEFGRKGALGVGARVGGLGNMPGWWYTVEAVSTAHLLAQFRQAIDEALHSKQKKRAIMRARSAKQRFPVAQWVKDLDMLQTTSIEIHDRVNNRQSRPSVRKTHTLNYSDSIEDEEDAYDVEENSLLQFPQMTTSHSLPVYGMEPESSSTFELPASQSMPNATTETASHSKSARHDTSILSSPRVSMDVSPNNEKRSPIASRRSSVHLFRPRLHATQSFSSLMQPQTPLSRPQSPESFVSCSSRPSSPSPSDSNYTSRPNSPVLSNRPSRPVSPTFIDGQSRPTSLDFLRASSSRPVSPGSSNGASRATSPIRSSLLLKPLPMKPVPIPSSNTSRATSPSPTPRLTQSSSTPFYMSEVESLTSDAVLGDKKNYRLQQVDPFFTDKQGVYKDKFETMLDKTDAIYKDSTIIEEYLVKSEKEWFQKYLNAKLGRESVLSQSSTLVAGRPAWSRASSMPWGFASRPMTPIKTHAEIDDDFVPRLEEEGSEEDFALGDDYETPRLLRNWLQIRIGDWPVYSFLLALGQIMAANSYQITLLTGQIGQEAERVYILCAIYMVSSVIFWLLFRKTKSVTVLTIPFILYGIAFLILALARFSHSTGSRGDLQNVATGFYTVASASGVLFFSLNFGDEGGATVISWIFRACVIQGTQQIYVTALWFWGSYLNKRTSVGLAGTDFLDSWRVTVVCACIAGALWIVAAILFLGLPDYYRQVPGRIPAFYPSILRRRIILWFFLTVIVQNFFLSTQYGRSWTFLWSSQHVPLWQIACLVIGYFIILWAILLYLFSKFSRSHSWLLPILAIGLGAPRWAQIWWGTSGMGNWLPWTGSYLASGLVSRSLWLWLGLLDTIQSVGIGMILLTTMTRIHVAFTLLTAQVIGAAVTAIARACAPNKLGPGPIFPNILVHLDSMYNAWFWLGLLLNLSLCIGFLLFFRKEQLNKP
jgi:alpha-1,3-glucan synthase